ncbi:MAG: tetratricopeptide repeat protein, partial [Dethiosulfovibrio sp.]|nr:tetratricopeptide repeat protein [Dethiosulfovibrio sp.]
MRKALYCLVQVISLAMMVATQASGDMREAVTAYNENRFEEAAALLLPEAKKGVALAQSTLGYLYDQGKGVSQDKGEALKWYSAAAKQGHAGAQYNLGLMYRDGEGIGVDRPQAIHWITKAAKQDHETAQLTLGLLLLRDSRDDPKKAPQAAQWLQKAAEKDNPSACYNLGRMYLLGEGVDQDRERAKELLQKAAESGHVYAQLDMGLLLEEDAASSAKEAEHWLNLASNGGYDDAQLSYGMFLIRHEREEDRKSV